MEIKELNIPGVFEITLKPHLDARGFFMRTYDIQIMRDAGLITDWKQENQSRSEQKGILRGLHFQFQPDCETKLVRCTRGSVYDVFVDLRGGSPTFGRWGALELNEENKKMLYIPSGLAHGYCTLTDLSEVLYKVDNFYAPKNEGGIKWNDPDLKIEWPVKDPILSERDKGNLTLETFIQKYKSLTH
jgi:dTDP-4-dehydrorhamnose 3,5-epimerase